MPLSCRQSAKSRWLRGNESYMGVWVAWVRGWVGWVGQIFAWVAWVTWVKIFFTWVIIFTWVAWVKFFCVSCVGRTYFVLFYFFLRRLAFIYQMRLCYYTTFNSLDIFLVRLFPADLDQTLFDLFNIFKWLIRNL